MRNYILFFLVLVGCSSSPYAHRLAVCAIFKNEAPWLREWIAYHRDVLGVTRFYLYNNESTDEYQEVLRPFIEGGLVELLEWDSADPSHLAVGDFMDAPWSGAQLGAYNDCLKKRALGQAQWVAMIDIDEFIVPVDGVKAFYKVLSRAEKHGKGTVSLEWRTFGTSEVEELVEGELLIEKLTRRARDDHPANGAVKSIHRPEAVDFCLVHIAGKLKPNFGAKTFKPNVARLNHYWFRTEKACLGKRKQAKEINPEFFEPFNEIEDQTILQYLPLVNL